MGDRAIRVHCGHGILWFAVLLNEMRSLISAAPPCLLDILHLCTAPAVDGGYTPSINKINKSIHTQRKLPKNSPKIGITSLVEVKVYHLLLTGIEPPPTTNPPSDTGGQIARSDCGGSNPSRHCPPTWSRCPTPGQDPQPLAGATFIGEIRGTWWLDW